MSLRAASARDAETIGSMHRRSAIAGYSHVFPTSFPPPPEDDFIRRWITATADESPWTVTVAEHARKIVGVVMFGPDPDGAGTGHIARIYVEPVRWVQGIGGVLHDHALHNLADAGHTEVTMWVLDGNDRAFAWFRRSGWIPTGGTRVVLEGTEIEERQLRRPVARRSAASDLRCDER